MRHGFITLPFAITLALGWATAASARGGENISHSGAEKICQYHGGISGSGCVFCGKVNCTVVTCKQSGGCNVLVHKYATRSVGGGRTRHRPRPVDVEGVKANGTDRRSAGTMNPNGSKITAPAYRGGVAGGGHHH